MNPLTPEQKQFADDNIKVFSIFTHRFTNDDLVSDIHLAYLKAVVTWNPSKAAFPTHAIYVMKGAESNFWKRMGRRKKVFQLSDEQTRRLESLESPLEELTFAEDLNLVITAIEECLPEREVEILYSILYDGQSFVQVAERLKLSSQTIHWLYKKSIMKVRRYLTLPPGTEVYW